MSAVYPHSLLLLLFVYTCAADPLGQFCNKNISSKSQISANTDFVLAELATIAAKARYLSFTYNAGPDSLWHGTMQRRCEQQRLRELY